MLIIKTLSFAQRYTVVDDTESLISHERNGEKSRCCNYYIDFEQSKKQTLPKICFDTQFSSERTAIICFFPYS